MSKPAPIGVIAIRPDGRSFVQAGCLIVFGASRLEWLHQQLCNAGDQEFAVCDIFLDEVIQSLEHGGDAWAFDRESFRAFDLLALPWGYRPTGTLMFGFDDQEMEPFIVFSRKHSEN